MVKYISFNHIWTKKKQQSVSKNTQTSLPWYIIWTNICLLADHSTSGRLFFDFLQKFWDG